MNARTPAEVVLPEWTYVPPRKPVEHPTQNWYRGTNQIRLTEWGARMGMYRSDESQVAQLEASLQSGENSMRLSLALDEAALLLLRDSINDVLAELIAQRSQVQADPKSQPQVEGVTL